MKATEEPVEKRSQWNFELADDGWAWSVVHADGTTERSARRWPTLKECAADASSRGYVAWKAEDERRREQVLEVAKALKRGSETS